MLLSFGDFHKEGLHMNMLNVGTYSPQQCEIASFSRSERHPDEIRRAFLFMRKTQRDYANTANAVNTNIEIDLVIVNMNI